MAQQSSANGFYNLIIMGNLAADPVLRYTAAGTAVCNWRMAVNLSVSVKQDDGSNVYEVHPIWVRVSAWGNQAEIANEHLRKGSRVLVWSSRPGFDIETGGPEIYTKGDGTPGTSFEITADGFKFADGAPARQEDGPIPGFEDADERISFPEAA